MNEKRLRNKIFQVWLHSNEYEFLKTYSESNMLTASETIRGLAARSHEKGRV